MLTHCTQHAEQRLAQRNVSLEALEILISFGTDLPAGQGRVRRELHAIQAAELRAEGYCAALVDKALRIEAILSADGVLITCYQRTPRARIGRAQRRRSVRKAHCPRRGGRT